MKSKLLFALLIAILGISCSNKNYLPTYDNIDIGKYGSFIKIIHKSNSIFEGELIAVDSNNVYVLTETEFKCINVPINEIRRFRLFYAKPKHYEWLIPLGVLNAFMHGAFSIITMPIHLLITGFVSFAGETDFTYTEKELSFQKLAQFARFPQGIPNHIHLSSIN